MNAALECASTETNARAGESGGNACTSSAVILSAINTLAVQPVRLQALGPSDLLLETHFTGIVPVLEGPLLGGALAHLPGMAYPLVPGYAAVGVVAAMGSDVSAEWNGAPIFAAGARAAAGMHAAAGTHGAHLVVPADEAVRLGDIPPRVATLLTEVAMALHALDLAAVAPGCRALVVGQGLSGQIVARALRTRGAGRIIVVDTRAHRLTRAQADETIRLPPPADERISDTHPEQSGNLDLVIDTIGEGRYIARWLPALRRGGALVLLSGSMPLAFVDGLAPRAALRIVRASDWTAADLSAATRLTATGAIALDDLISHTIPVARVGQAYVIALSDPDAMQVVLAWG